MIAVLALATFGLLLQDAPPPLPPPPDAAQPATIVLDADGEPVAAGRLPKSTSTEARAAWDRLAAAVATAGEARTPIRGFDLALDLRLRVQENRTNEFPDARYAYLAPAFLLADTGKGRSQMRGPKGDWLYDATQPAERSLVRLDVGRENAEDRRQLDEALDVARLFVLLIDSRNVRVIRFAATASPEAFLPTKVVDTAQTLSWFELETPDVRPGAQNKSGARILLGMSKDSGLPVIVLADDAAAPRRINPTTSCVSLSDWKRFDGWLLPKKLLVYLPRIVDAEGAGGVTSRVADGWRAEPAMDLIVKSGSLKAPLRPEDFLPPDPTRLAKPPSGG
ncbi:MAG: hypothetical protein NTY35_10975 [Planctomycetota bacterium]|nr:hypothetical protein [Planctomycetota bacterium]